MADGTSGGRVGLMVLVAVLALGAGATALFVATRPEAPGASPSSTPTATNAKLTDDLERLRASYAKLERDQMELQRRLAQVNRELEEARSAQRAGESSQSDKWEPTPTDKPAMAASDVSQCVVQAVDNKHDIFVLSQGSKDGVQIGMEFEIRRGTKAIGSIVVDKVFPNYASGGRKPGSAAFDVAAGDECTRAPSAK